MGRRNIEEERLEMEKERNKIKTEEKRIRMTNFGIIF